MWPFPKRAEILEPAAAEPERNRDEVLREELATVREQMAALDSEFRTLRFKYFYTTPRGRTILATRDHAESMRVLGEQQRILRARDRLKARFDSCLQQMAERKTACPQI